MRGLSHGHGQGGRCGTTREPTRHGYDPSPKTPRTEPVVTMRGAETLAVRTHRRTHNTKTSATQRENGHNDHARSHRPPCRIGAFPLKTSRPWPTRPMNQFCSLCRGSSPRSVPQADPLRGRRPGSSRRSDLPLMTEWIDPRPARQPIGTGRSTRKMPALYSTYGPCEALNDRARLWRTRQPSARSRGSSLPRRSSMTVDGGSRCTSRRTGPRQSCSPVTVRSSRSGVRSWKQPAYRPR